MFTISVDATRPYISVSARGTAGLDELSELAARIAKLTEGQAHSRVLADLSAIEANLSFTDHLQFGSLVWELLGGVERLAAVVPAEFLDGGAARAAQMTGAPLKTFVAFDEATRWLGGASPRPIRVRRRASRRHAVREA